MTRDIDLIELQNYLKEMMKDFISICNKYNLTYFAEAGTAIGVVRHKGFIPWDDDIDIYMPKEDYLKLISLKEEIAKNTEYEIFDINNKGAFLPFIKLCKKKSTIQEEWSSLCVFGIYIDIFPLINCNGDLNVLSKIRNKREKYSDILYRANFTLYYTIKNLFKAISKFNFREILTSILSLVYKIFANYYRKKFIELNNNAFSLEGDYYWDYGCSFNLERTIFPKDWFDKSMSLPFEDIEMNVPHRVHEYLTLQYGDYMKIPDVSDRKTHKKYFIDFNKRYTFEEIDKIKRFVN